MMKMMTTTTGRCTHCEATATAASKREEEYVVVLLSFVVWFPVEAITAEEEEDDDVDDDNDDRRIRIESILRGVLPVTTLSQHHHHTVHHILYSLWGWHVDGVWDGLSWWWEWSGVERVWWNDDDNIAITIIKHYLSCYHRCNTIDLIQSSFH